MSFQLGFSSGELSGVARPKRSKSFPDGRGHTEETNLVKSTEESHVQELDKGRLNDLTNSKNQQPSSDAVIEHSLRQEILLLEKRLQDQVSIRCALERALGYKASSHDIADEARIPQPATELINEIALLEQEVGHLEQYLLSLYRKAFDEQACLSPPKEDEGLKSSLTMPHRKCLDFSKSDVTSARKFLPAEARIHPDSKKSNGPPEVKAVDFGVQRSHSSLSQTVPLANATCRQAEPLGKALRTCHSQPLSMIEYAQTSSLHTISLAEHLGAHIPETPNKISEDMVKCMCNVYCRLADPLLANKGLSSPISSSPSTSTYSPNDQHDLWSPGLRNNSSLDFRLDNPFHVEGLKDFSGPYSSMIEVNSIYRDSQKSGDTEYLLQKFRSLVSRLQGISPGKMTHEEKLAFWINVHNALLMHAYLVYGIPQSNMRRMFLLSKAAYNIGGQIVSADAIQISILGCRMQCPGKWLRLLVPSITKFKAHDEHQKYGIEDPEPLLYFALSSGSHSDPAVRVYTPKRVLEELEAAKQDYVRATYGVQRDHRLLLPKIVHSFAKDSSLSPAATLEMIYGCLPECIKKSRRGKDSKTIKWVPHNFAFRLIGVSYCYTRDPRFAQNSMAHSE